MTLTTASDVVSSARGSCLDQAARRMNPQALSVEDGFQLEFRRERCGGGGVSRLAPLVGRTLNWLRGADVDFGFNVRLGEFENSKPYGK